MKIWLTSKWDDDGIQEVEADAAYSGGYRAGDVLIWNMGLDYVHTTRESAVEVATRFRQERIAEAVALANKLINAPPLAL